MPKEKPPKDRRNDPAPIVTGTLWEPVESGTTSDLESASESTPTPTPSEPEPSPSLDQMGELMVAALRFRDLGCWDWLNDSDVFGVQDPVSGEIGYCAVMGRLGIAFGLAVYLGDEGLVGYLTIQSEEDMPSRAFDVLALQKGMIVSFEDRKLLTREDLEVIRNLGLKLRGRNAWPLFRSYRPGYQPWYLTAEEARILTVALEQVIEVAERFRDDTSQMQPREGRGYLIRKSEPADGELLWRDEWIEPSLPRTRIDVYSLNENDLRDLSQLPQAGMWELDFGYTAAVISEKRRQRPSIPMAVLLVDRDSELLLAFQIFEPSELSQKIVEVLVGALHLAQARPREIHVRRQEAVAMLAPTVGPLRIILRYHKRLAVAEHVWASMDEFMRRP